MYRGNNKVAMASQQRIRKALLALLEREDFDSISTSALCREAAVSRQTFYNLYSSKEDVVVDLLGYYRDVYKRQEWMPERRCGSLPDAAMIPLSP